MKQQVKKMRNQVDLGEDLIAEILARLLAKSVLRVRTVCKAWRRITSGQAFLAAHARHGPLDVLLYSYENDIVNLDAVPVSADTQPARRCLARFPEKHPRDRARQYCLLVASCDGLLLLRNQHTGQHHVCNPATRRWADLPQISDRSSIHRACGFYFHEPSGEYRLLSYVNAAYYIFSAGSDEPRRLSVQATPTGKGHTADGFICLSTPAVLRGHLHWLWHPEAGLTGQMVAFDTVAETFRRMRPPPVTHKYMANLLVADGRLMASELAQLLVDLWVLEDYGAAGESWELRYRVELPWKTPLTLMFSIVAGSDEGDVVLGSNRGLVVYNVRSRMVRVVDVQTKDGGSLLVSRYVIRESLVPQRFFEARQYSGLPLFSFS